jgi:hypothetical protein
MYIAGNDYPLLQMYIGSRDGLQHPSTRDKFYSYTRCPHACCIAVQHMEQANVWLQVYVR